MKRLKKYKQTKGERKKNEKDKINESRSLICGSKNNIAYLKYYK